MSYLASSLLTSWLILSVAVWITSLLLPGFYVKGAGQRDAS